MMQLPPLFELMQADLRERWRLSEALRLRRAATRRQARWHQSVLAVLSGLLIAAGQRMQAPSQTKGCWSQACCVPYMC
jgi:hypothetical protein